MDTDGREILDLIHRGETLTLENLLVTAPRSRNPLLADIVKRIGIAARTGRGIDRIYEGMLRYGRPPPDYGMSNTTTVTVQMFSTEADLSFLRMILQREDETGTNMPVDSLIILSRLKEERRLNIASLALAVQKSDAMTRASLEKLVEAGLVEAHGAGRGRTYTLSAKLYQHAEQKAAYIREAGFSPIRQGVIVKTGV